MPQSGQSWDPRLLESHALLRPFEPLTARFRQHTDWPSLGEYSLLAEQRRAARCPEQAPIHFALSAPKRSRARRDTPLDPARLYDGSIALRAEVPCLSQSYHDLFNAVVWSAFPTAKRALHQRQFRALCEWLPAGAARLPNRRTREQDALTVFDEGGSALVVDRATWARLCEPHSEGPSEHPNEHQPVHPSIEAKFSRPPSGASSVCSDLSGVPGVELVLFGHALMEHVAYGRESVRSAAMVLVLNELPARGLALLDLLDHHLSERLRDPASFLAPGVDAVVELGATGELRLWHSR